jgi:hypothetical protein
MFVQSFSKNMTSIHTHVLTTTLRLGIPPLKMRSGMKRRKSTKMLGRVKPPGVPKNGVLEVWVKSLKKGKIVRDPDCLFLGTKKSTQL